MLNAISPIDGRYASKTRDLSPYFSELGLIHRRVQVEIEYFIALSEFNLPELPELPAEAKESLREIYRQFSEVDAQKVKDIEMVTNHDVKAVEYLVKEKIEELGYGQYQEWVHFALTSQDINNTSMPILIKEAVDDVILLDLRHTLRNLTELAEEYREVPMLAHTHGQPASPTTVGKEIRVFAERLAFQIASVERIEHYGKFGGATGNFNAHLAAYPDRDWVTFGNDLLTSFGLRRIPTTTQIDHYDHLAELLHIMVRISNLLTDLCRDIWTYISMEYFTQKTIKGEVGSSTMPHKVNPIDFENAEGNLGLAVAMFDHLANKLPISRLQRDLTDSTVLRNVGVPFAHVLIALKSLNKGLGKLQLNQDQLENDLQKNWMVVAEAIQTVLRREGVDKPYELLKDLTRGTERVTSEVMNAFIEGLSVEDSVKNELKRFTPHNYLGNAGE